MLENDPEEHLRLYDFAQIRLLHHVQLQKHPHKLRVCLQKGPQLEQNDIIIRFSCLPDLTALLTRTYQLLLCYPLYSDLLLL